MKMGNREASAGVETAERSLPVGADVVPRRGVHFRVWAPTARSTEVVVEGGQATALRRESDGYFSGLVPGLAAGARYRLRLDGGEKLYPDPASRYQPEGPHGPSEVVDGSTFRWTDGNWRGVGAAGQVLYEMHVGTFTKEGTWAAAMRELPVLAELGVTCLEVMPVNEFAGEFGWGYDGVDPFAPSHLYGTPDDFRRFVDRAHAVGIGVILDVVYNHFGPDGCYLTEFSETYFTDKHKNDWGKSINFDGPESRAVREFFVANAEFWIREFHLDGFRFDATQAILDESPRHILAEICAAARRAAGGRGIYLINENEPQHTRIVRPESDGGYGMDALWNDDFHHSAMLVISGHDEAYYTDYRGLPQEFISGAKYGYLYQGQRYQWQGKRRGTPALDLPATAFVNFIQNHDQIANSGTGLRAHQVSSPGVYRAMTALMLLMPQTPMLFQGQEFGASSPFHYFADHPPELAPLVKKGRAKELSQFPTIATHEMQARLADPADRRTFEASKLDWSEREKPGHAALWQMHKDLLRLRREEAVFARVRTGGRRGSVDGAVIGPEAFVLRYFADDGVDDRVVLVNFGRDLRLSPAPEPLLAPPAGMRWKMVWSSEDPRYGGAGTAAVETENEGWLVHGRCTIVVRPVAAEEGVVETRVKKAGDGEVTKDQDPMPNK